MSKEIELHEKVREDIRIDLLCEDVIALTEHLRLKEEECKQLQHDKAELVELVESAYIEGCHDGYREGLSDGQDFSSSKNNLEPDESWDISESKTKLEKHK